MPMARKSSNTAQKIHLFFEQPKSLTAKLVQAGIFVLILLSLASLTVEYRYPTFFAAHRTGFDIAEAIILGAFTLEYVLRIATAPRKMQWALRPMNMVDFVAVFPSYLEIVLHTFANTSSVRVLRLIRILRFSRVLRAFKLFKFGNLFNKILKYEGTILQTITPIIVMFTFAKCAIWTLEAHDFWIQNPSLGELFAIIGFALGIILSQKIGVTYEKFLQVEEAAVRLTGTLKSLEHIFTSKKKAGQKATKQWAKDFLTILKNPKADNKQISAVNQKLYSYMQSLESTPAEIAVMYKDICNDAGFCLSKKERLTPRAYDTLLHQATMLYLAMIVVFIPGFTGLVSVALATYTLYGMYNLTEDLDSIIGGEFNLIDIDISELEQFASD